MFFAALTSATKMLPQLVQTKRDRLMRLTASTVPQALLHCEVSAGSTATIRKPYHAALYSSMVRAIRSDTSSRDRLKLDCRWTSFPDCQPFACRSWSSRRSSGSSMTMTPPTNTKVAPSRISVDNRASKLFLRPSFVRSLLLHSDISGVIRIAECFATVKRGSFVRVERSAHSQPVR